MKCKPNSELESRPAGAEIEATPEMIEAGAKVICSVTFDLGDQEFWAEKVYRAMAALNPRAAG